MAERELLIPVAISCTGQTVTTEMLEQLRRGSLGRLRVECFDRHGADQPARLACPHCGQAVWPNLAGHKRLHLCHFSGEAASCPLNAGGISYEELETRLYAGRQEGALHSSVVERLEQMARQDRRVIPESVKSGEYLRDMTADDLRGRFPDLRFDTADTAFAFEVQIAPITVRRIVERMKFYRSQGRVLVWVHWCFDPDIHRKAWYWDILGSSRSYYTYSMSPDIEERSRLEGRFQLEQFRYRNALGQFEKEIVDLDRISADSDVADAQQWASVVRSRWAARFAEELPPPAGSALLKEVLDRCGLLASREDLYPLLEALNVFIAIERGRVTGKKSPNLPSQIIAHLYGDTGALTVAAAKQLLARYQPEILAGTAEHARKVPEKIADAEARAAERASDKDFYRLSRAVDAILETLFWHEDSVSA